MKTERLYYTDSWLRSFDARVLRAEPAGEKVHVLLDRTAFYPASGGQPFDTGTLGTARVSDVFESESGEVVHVADRLPEGGGVHGEVDWARRFDHMQQHTGQHLLSAVWMELFKRPTVSFHMGEDLSTVDLEGGALSEEQVRRAGARANEIVFEDRPVNVFFAAREEAAALGLRKEVEREGQIRIIEIEKLDRTACGGTHLARTGQIGAILLRKVEKVRQGMRVEFACGGRAVEWARRDYQALTSAAAAYTSHPHELPQIVRKKIEESKAAEKERQRLLHLLAAYEAREMYAQTAPDGQGLRTIEKVLDADPAYVRFLAAQVAAQPNARAVFAVRRPPTLVLAQSKGLAADLGAVVKKLGLRGGGSRDSAQAGAEDEKALEMYLERIRLELK